MVVKEYLRSDINLSNTDLASGFLAVAFHDAGKPEANRDKEGRSVFYGHELISARLAEDWLIINRDNIPFGFDLGKVIWLIENHLYYKVKPEWARATIDWDLYYKVVMADCRGRISDDYKEKIFLAEFWFKNPVTLPEPDIKLNEILFMIGCSGSGKSTWLGQRDGPIFSMDTLRLDWYPGSYQEAWKHSTEDSGFSGKVLKEFNKFVKQEDPVRFVDNCHVSIKSRKEFLTVANKAGLRTVAVVFQNSLENIAANLLKRPEKPISFEVARSQYFKTQQPSLGEFDEIMYVRPWY
jgi:predicted kinase